MAKTKDFIQDDRNFNKGTEEGAKLMKKSLHELGAGRSILVDRNNRIIAGNKTQLAAIDAGIDEAVETTGDKLVVVKRTDVDIDSKEGRELALADNKSTEVNLAWDDVQLQSVAEEFDIPLPDWGFDLPDVDEPHEEDPDTSAEDNFDEDEQEIETRVKAGEVWQLGEHRLMCGDSTKAEDVKALMNGEQAVLWLTDPPYNVDYNAKNEYLNEVGKGGCVQKDIENDQMTDDEFHGFLMKVFALAVEALKNGGGFYVWSPQGHTQVEITKALDDSGLQFKQQLIWVKNNFVLGRMDYQWKHEPCFYGWKPGAGHYFINVRNETTVIPDAEELNIDKMTKKDMQDLLHKIFDSDIPTSVINENKPQKSELHPTMKPVRLFGRLIHNSAKRGDIVLDTFGGSGTTLIACEQLGRRCRIMELDPHYCDVILTRWEKLTGKVAVNAATSDTSDLTVQT